MKEKKTRGTKLVVYHSPKIPSNSIENEENTKNLFERMKIELEQLPEIDLKKVKISKPQNLTFNR